jgi:autotransporter-associated beta strand protein
VNAVLGSGDVTVDTGTTTLGSAGRLNSGSGVTINSGGLTLGGNESVASFTNAGGTLGGSSILTSAGGYDLKGGTINATLGTGAVRVNTGTTTLGSGGRFNSASSVTMSGGGLALGGNESLVNYTQSAGTLSGSGTLTANNYILSGGNVNASIGVGNVTVTGSGTVTLNGTSSADTVTVNSGTLTAGAANRISDSATLNINGGTFNIGSFSDTVGSVTLNSGTILGSGTITAGSYTAQSGSIAASLAGTGVAFTKNGIGTVTLSGNNSYSGATVLNAGKLVENGSNGSSAVTVNSGATLSGTGSLGAVSVLAGGTIAPGNTTRTLNVTSLNLASNSAANFQIVNTNTFSSIHAGGAVNYGGKMTISLNGTYTEEAPGIFNLFLANSFSGNFQSITIDDGVSVNDLVSNGYNIWSDMTPEYWASYNIDTGILTVVPEPSTYALFSMGAALLLGGWYRRRKQQS